MTFLRVDMVNERDTVLLNIILDHIQEECAEIIKAASKIKRFGLDSKNPVTGATNAQEFIDEMNDFDAVRYLLQEDANLSLPLNQEDLIKKVIKKRKFIAQEVFNKTTQR